MFGLILSNGKSGESTGAPGYGEAQWTGGGPVGYSILILDWAYLVIKAV